MVVQTPEYKAHLARHTAADAERETMRNAVAGMTPRARNAALLVAEIQYMARAWLDGDERRAVLDAAAVCMGHCIAGASRVAQIERDQDAAERADYDATKRKFEKGVP